MAKRVEKDHTVVDTGNQEIPAEALLKAQEAAFDEVGTSESEDVASDAEPKTAKAEKKTQIKNGLILVGAATYAGCGLHFAKGEPTAVEDEAVYNKLLSTGLFNKA